MAIEQPLERELLQEALQHYSAGEFAEALNGFEKIGSIFVHPQLKLCQAVAAFHVGRLDLTHQLFEEVPPDTWSCYEQEVFLHAHWANSTPLQLLEKMRSCSWDSAPLQYLRRFLEGSGKLQLPDSCGDLARPESQRWIVHPMFRLVALHKVRLRVFFHPSLQIEGQLEAALEFFRRELPGCPEFSIQTEVTPELPEAQSCLPEMNKIGDLLDVLGARLKPWEYGLVLTPQANWALSSGVARHSGRLASLQLGHLAHHRSLVIAHELAHLLLDLPDISSDSAYGGSLSLMSSDWDLILPATHLDPRSKAACLTPLAAHKLVLAGKQAEKSADFAQALRYYQAGFEKDRWHLALGLAQLRLMRVLKRKKSLEVLAQDLMERFPLASIELRILGLLEKSPDLEFQGDIAGAARTLLAQGKPRLAERYLKSLPSEVVEGPEILGCRAWSALDHWEPRKAFGYAEKALQQAPGHFKLHELMALVQLQLGHFGPFREFLQRASQLQGRTRLPKLYRFYVHLAKSDFNRASDYLVDALKKQPANDSFWNQLGLIQIRHLELKSAQASLAKAVQLKATAYNRACLALAQDKRALARKLALQASRQAKSLAPALELLAYLEPREPAWLDQLYAQVPGYVRTLVA